MIRRSESSEICHSGDIHQESEIMPISEKLVMNLTKGVMFLSRKKGRQLVKSSNHKTRAGNSQRYQMILDWIFFWKMYFLWFVASCLDVKEIHSQDFGGQVVQANNTLRWYPRVHLIGFERGKRRVLVADSGCPGLGGIGKGNYREINLKLSKTDTLRYLVSCSSSLTVVLPKAHVYIWLQWHGRIRAITPFLSIANSKDAVLRKT